MSTVNTPRRTVRARDLPMLMSIDEVAEHLGVSVRHIRRLVAERRVPYLKWGHLLRFDPEELGEWIESQRVQTWSPR